MEQDISEDNDARLIEFINAFDLEPEKKINFLVSKLRNLDRQLSESIRATNYQRQQEHFNSKGN